MKLCIDARWIRTPGHGRFLKNALEALSQDYSLFVLHHEKDKSEFLSYPCTLISVKSKPYSFLEQLELPLKIPRVDVFWSPHFNIPLLPIRAKKRLVTLHDAYHLVHPSQFSFLQKTYARVFYNASCLLADHVMTVSDFSKKELLKTLFCRPKKFTVVPNGISLEKFTRGKRLSDKFHLPEKFLLIVGNCKEHKNIERAIAAYEAIDCEEELVIVGGEFECHSKKKIHFTRFVVDADLPPLYTLASCLVFPSLYEGFGLPPIEAMACGCPVLASAIVSVKEVCGNCVEYFDPLDVDSIKNALLNVLKDKKRKEELIKCGLVHVKKYALEKWKEEICEVISSCCHCP